jgi:parallel beta-helix repeat protein
MEISRRSFAIHEAGASNITLQNLQTSDATTADIYFNGGVFMTISNTSAINSFGQGIRFDVVASSTIVSSTAAWNGADGIAADDAPGLVINGCVAYDNASLANVNFTAGIKINPDYPPYPPSTNVTIENSEAYGNGPGQAASGEWIGMGIWADTIRGGLLIQRNRVYDNNLMGIYLDADSNAVAAYNVVYGNGHSGAIDGGGIAVYGDGRSITANSVYGNTVYGNLWAGIKVFGANLANGCENTAVENNIAVGTVSGPNFAATGGCENSGRNGTGNVYAYNALGMPSPNFVEYGAGNYLSTYAAFDAAYGTSTHSVKTDPLFTNASTNDFTLTPTSPAIDAGTNLGGVYQNALAHASTWPSHVLTANQNSDGSGWSVGAYAYVQ